MNKEFSGGSSKIFNNEFADSPDPIERRWASKIVNTFLPESSNFKKLFFFYVFDRAQ